MVLVDQVRSSVMCTPRNLVLLTLSTVELSMVNGVRPPEVHHNLLCLTHIEGQIVSATPFSQLCHFLSVRHFQDEKIDTLDIFWVYIHFGFRFTYFDRQVN